MNTNARQPLSKESPQVLTGTEKRSFTLCRPELEPLAAGFVVKRQPASHLLQISIRRKEEEEKKFFCLISFNSFNIEFRQRDSRMPIYEDGPHA